MYLPQLSSWTSTAHRKIHILLPITLVYILGIVCHTVATNYQILLVMLGLIAVVCLVVGKLSHQVLLITTTFLSIFMLGGFLHTHQHTTFDTFFFMTSTKSWNVRGKIINKETTESNFPYCTTIAVSSLQEHGTFDWTSTNSTVVIHSLLEPYCQVDDVVEIKEINFKKAKNSDYNRYLIKEGINATLFIPKITWKLNARPIYSAWRTIHTIKESLLRTIQEKTNTATFALFSSLFLGNRSATKQELNNSKQNFAVWGLSHYLARSGLHLAIFAMILESLLRFLPIALNIKHVLAIVISVLYFLLSWSSISFIRSLAMFLLYKCCALLITRIHVFHILTLVTLGTLLYNPAQLFFLDFQLSFGLTGALAWISGHASKKLF